MEFSLQAAACFNQRSLKAELHALSPIRRLSPEIFTGRNLLSVSVVCEGLRNYSLRGSETPSSIKCYTAYPYEHACGNLYSHPILRDALSLLQFCNRWIRIGPGPALYGGRARGDRARRRFKQPHDAASGHDLFRRRDPDNLDRRAAFNPDRGLSPQVRCRARFRNHGRGESGIDFSELSRRIAFGGRQPSELRRSIVRRRRTADDR